jgi:outer membrane protein TolC
MRYTIYLSFLLLFSCSGLFSQETESVLDEYIRFGLDNNLSLKQKHSDWLEAEMKLKQAKGLFYPEISLNARYTIADGGRVIEFPVGDLLNPVYSTLNLLTASDRFPQIENEEFPFLRPTEHETKLRLTQPILNTDIFYNKKISENRLNIKHADIRSYRRTLVFEIKQAYFNHLKAREILDLLNNTLPVLEENLRVNRSLYENNKVTRDVILRSESEISQLEENIAAAEGSVEVSAAYFNFLLNRDLSEGIEISKIDLPLLQDKPDVYIDRAVEQREELLKLQYYSHLAQNNLDMNKAGRLPEIFAVVDYGFQGEEYSFTEEDDFVMASVVLKWNIFKGFQERSQITEARIMNEKIDYQIEETQNMIRLEVMNTWYDFISARKKLEASRENSRTASEVFRMVNKKYSENQASLLQFMDARNNMTVAAQNVIINTWDTLIRYAELEKAAALYSINNEN